jgi:signal transduction histidine kinase
MSNSSHARERRYEAVFQGAPVAIWEEDFSEVEKYLRRLRETGISDLRQHLTAHPEDVGECTRLVKVLCVNQLALEFYGATSQEELIARLPDLFDPATLDVFREEVLAFAEGKTNFEAEIETAILSGERRLVRMNVSILSSREPWSWVVVAFTDLTDHHALEEKLRRTNLALEQFAFAAAHDLREPLRTIALYAQLLKKVQADAATVQGAKAVEFILESATRMDTLVSDLLAFAQTMEVPAVDRALRSDSQSAAEEALRNLAVTIAQTNAVVETDSLPAVAAEHSHVRQLFQNLIGNAVKYRHPDRVPEIRIGWTLSGHEIVFCVADNGIGIEPEYHKRIFGIFRRLHGRSIQGNGIGLALCKRLVEHYNGQIWVQSEPGRGTHFYFSLPRAHGG